MKTLSVPTALLLLLFNCSAAFGTQSSTQSPPLQLTTTVISHRYCGVGTDVDALQLNLRLRYTNTGRQKLILYKGHNLFYQITVSRNAAEAATRKYELFATSALYFDEEPEVIERSTPGRVFVILSPGDTYETERAITIPVIRESIAQVDGAVAPGEHVLQLIVSTWYESKNLAEKLRQRWQRSGYLWSDGIFSVPMKFSVEKQHSVVTCQ